MAIRHFNPVTPGQRKKSTLVNEELTKTAPEKSLLKAKNKKSGRNNQGRITVRHQGGGAKQKYRLIDFKRNKDGRRTEKRHRKAKKQHNGYITIGKSKNNDLRYQHSINRLSTGFFTAYPQ